MVEAPGLAERFAQVRARVAAACARVGRAPETVQLIAVSKRQPMELVRAAYALGHRHFGENYAQELRDKHAALADLPGLRWHAIGPLQLKNAKYVAKAAHYFHALEDAAVAKELARRRTGAPLQCFIEVNLAHETSKAGVTASALPALADEVRALPQLQLVGLMGMPPFVEDGEENRIHFQTLATLAKNLGLSQLSMGSTTDFEVAIEEGATQIRVGTALFGARPAK